MLLAAPYHPSVGRCTHQDKAIEVKLATISTGIVPFDVAMTVEFTGSCVITDNPGLIKKAKITSASHFHWFVPIQSICRATNKHSSPNRRTVNDCDTYGGNHPGLVSSIVGN